MNPNSKSISNARTEGILLPTRKAVKDAMRNFAKSVYVFDDMALRLAFDKHPHNSDRAEVLLKVTALNALYNTRIMNVRPVVDHILRVRPDAALQAADVGIVDRLKCVTFTRKDGSSCTKNMYSFASKYCNFHRPDDYPIYDRFVDIALRHFRSVDRAFDFPNAALHQYPQFRKLINDFQVRYGLVGMRLKEIDKYLWSVGKRVDAMKRNDEI